MAVAIEHDSARRGMFRVFTLGLTTGFVYFGGTTYWVDDVMWTYGGLSPWVAALVAGLMASYLALYVGLFAVLLGVGIRRLGVKGLWLAPFFWVGTEWLRSWLLMGGFPWVLLGSSQATVLPIVQLASVFGVFGLSFLVALVGSAAAAVAVSRRGVHVRGAFATLALVGVVALGGMLRVAAGTLTESGRVIRVGLVQGSIEQDAKWDPAFRDSIFARYLTLSRQALGAGAALVVWPESSTPFYFEATSALGEPVRALASQARTPFIIGTDEFERGVGPDANHIYNAAVLVGADGRLDGSYRKMRLVPFGEYVPFKSLLFFVGPLVQAVSDFSAGTEPTVLDTGRGRVSVAICYESVYPWIARAFADRGSELLAVITNDAWFGRSSAAYQHFEQGGLRAVEEGRYVVRAANTGISGAIDPYGRVLARTPLFQPTSITVDVRLLDARTIYSRLGDVVAWFSAVVSGLVLGVGRRRPLPGHGPVHVVR